MWDFGVNPRGGGAGRSGRGLVAAPLVEGFQKILDGLLLGPEIAVQYGHVGDRPGALLGQVNSSVSSGANVRERHFSPACRLIRFRRRCCESKILSPQECSSAAG